ncbi:unnamed protein product [Allacma fusca]|uniref:GDNF/GAS1 domain-containing protein n=1 Tax=Allacma fusca TaxID=39272 RepID=A0A8J2P6D1_9HEXA|nr:unnamed protein product [Allacma fusca]
MEKASTCFSGSSRHNTSELGSVIMECAGVFRSFLNPDRSCELSGLGLKESVWRSEMDGKVVGEITSPSQWTMASEFPERECCDPVYPVPAPVPHNGQGGAPAFPEYVASTPPATTEVPGVQPKTATALMNCLQAREFCVENSACSPILQIVPRVCGSEKVACSTVTITKCQAALRTLQAFPYFSPVCLCPTPTSDPACSTFRDYLFDHPCTTAKERDKDPYPVDALPTCDHAMEVCRKQPKCFQLYKDFKNHCKTADRHCKMDDGELCHDAWTRLRFTPMFGCICPNHNHKCDRVFSEVNNNPCVASGPPLDFTGTNSALLSLEGHKERGLHYSFSPVSLFPKPRTIHHQHAYDQDTVIVPAARTDSHLYVDESFSTPISYHGYPSPESIPTTHSGSITVQVMWHSPEQEIESQLETPLLGPAADRDINKAPFIPSYLSPTKITSHHTNHPSTAHQPRTYSGITTISSIRPHAGSGRSSQRFTLLTTCSSSLQNCQLNPSCSTLLHSVLYWCTNERCRKDTCMLALQSFYRGVEPKWAFEVAFCLCRKTENREDECLVAQEQLHPVCAQRADQGVHPPSCHSLAESCRSQPDCKSRLEHFEQACAVDSVTRKCAGPSSECRIAIVGILGTKLRTRCACNGTDVTHVYDCLGWQRILWFNPCVVDTQKEYIRQRAITTSTSTPRTPSTQNQASTESVTISSETVTGGHITSTILVSSYPSTEGEISSSRNTLDYGTTTRGGSITTDDVTTLSTTTSRPMTTTTTAPPRYCVIRRPNQRDQKIIEGTSKRLYRDDEPSCSELCLCMQGEPPSCVALDCLDTRSCEDNTKNNPSQVTYLHRQPTYFAYRGHCVCYAGDFICEKPAAGSYTLYPGVFLFLGYSKKDEDILKPHTRMAAEDVVSSLQQLISPHSINQHVHHPEYGNSQLRKLNETSCRLDLFKTDFENLIINATVVEDDGANSIPRQTIPESFLHKEREQCLPVLEVIKQLVNDNDPIIHSHTLLSILKKADVVVNSIPPSTREPDGAPRTSAFVIVVFFLPLHFLLSILLQDTSLPHLH